MVEAAWRIATPILDVWRALPARDFPNYAAGSWGPAAADELLHAGRPALVHDSADPRRRHRRHEHAARVVRGRDGRLVPGAARTYPSREHAGLDEIVRTFLRDAPGQPRRACFGIAGPGAGRPRRGDEPAVGRGRAAARRAPGPGRGAPGQRSGGERVGAGGPAATRTSPCSSRARGADGQRRGHLRGHRSRRGRPRVGRAAAPAVRVGGRPRRLGAAGRAAARAVAVPRRRGGPRERGARALRARAPQRLPVPARRAGAAPSPGGSPTRCGRRSRRR